MVTAAEPGGPSEDIPREWAVLPDHDLSSRHKLIAHMAASGAPSSQIANEMNMTLAWVSHVVNSPKVRALINEIHARSWGTDVGARFQKAVPKAMDVIEDVLDGTDPETKVRDRADAAKWLLEKVTGKARQEIEVESGTSILKLLQLIEQMKADGKVIDVTPGAVASQAESGKNTSEVTEVASTRRFDDWISKNLK